MLRHYLKKQVSAAFFQAQLRTQPTIETQHLQLIEKKYGVTISLESQKTNTGRSVMELKIWQTGKTPNKATALFQGTGSLIDLPKIIKASELAATNGEYIYFMREYPGAGKGKVTIFSINEITEDSVEFLKRLASHYNIVFVKSISMGAAVACCAVAECHRTGYKNVYGLFARTYRCFVVLLASRFSHPEIAYPILKVVLTYTEFNLSTAKHFLDIPKEYKYAYRIEGDTVVPESASLVEDPEVRLENLEGQKCGTAVCAKHIAFYQQRTVFKPVKEHPKDPHAISESQVYLDDTDITAEEIGKSYIEYIENHSGMKT